MRWPALPPYSRGVRGLDLCEGGKVSLPEVLKETRSAPRTARQPVRASSAGQRRRHMEDRSAADAFSRHGAAHAGFSYILRAETTLWTATFRCNTSLPSNGTSRQFLSPSKRAPSSIRCAEIIARIDSSCCLRVALTSPLTEAVWSLDASRSVRKICACFINKAVFGVSLSLPPSLCVAPLLALFLAPLVQPCCQPSLHSCCWLRAPCRSA